VSNAAPSARPKASYHNRQFTLPTLLYAIESNWRCGAPPSMPSQTVQPSDEQILFRTTFEALTGNRPFPWQEDLYLRFFSKGQFQSSGNLPTGLGKTSVVAIWIVALAHHPEHVPRRLVYVVNRRTVVDQTSNEVERLRCNLRIARLFDPLSRLCALPLNDGELPLAISTLRGQFADNRAWSADPARPAVVRVKA